MKLKKLWLALVAVVAVGFAVPTLTAHADASFSDLNNVTASKVSYWDDGTGAHVSLVKIVADTQNVYISIENHSSASTNPINSFQESAWTLKVGSHTFGTIHLGSTRGAAISNGTVAVNNEWNPEKAVGTATVTRETKSGVYTDDYSVMQMKISLADLGVTDAKIGDAISLDGTSAGFGNQSSAATVGSIGASATPVAPTTDDSNVDDNGVVADAGDADTTAGDQNNSNDNLGIVIDGAYKDWTNVPQSAVGNGGAIALVNKGMDVFGYVKSPLYNTVQVSGYTFVVGGKTYYATIAGGIPSLTTDGSAVAIALVGGDYWGDTKYGTIGTGYIQRIKTGEYGSYSDRMEFKVDLTKLGLSSTDGQTIKFGDQDGGSITTAGGSTGPIILASIGVLCAGFGYMKFKKRGVLTPDAIRIQTK